MILYRFENSIIYILLFNDYFLDFSIVNIYLFFVFTVLFIYITRFTFSLFSVSSDSNKKIIFRRY